MNMMLANPRSFRSVFQTATKLMVALVLIASMQFLSDPAFAVKPDEMLKNPDLEAPGPRYFGRIAVSGLSKPVD